MHRDKHYVDHVREIREMRARYVGGLLRSGWNAVLDYFRSAAQFPARGRLEQTPDLSHSGIVATPTAASMNPAPSPQARA